MIPLSSFLIAWVFLLAVFGFAVLLTLIQTLRHGLPGVITSITTFLFLAVIALVVMGVGGYLTTVDWTQTVQLIPQNTDAFFIGV